MGSPRSHLLVILILQAAHLICLMSLGAAALNFSYNFSIPDPGGLQELMFVNGSARRSDLVYLSVPGKMNSTGRAFYAKPVRLWDRRTGKRASFNTTFSFVITRGSNDNSSLGLGEGMAFFIAPFPTSLPPVSGGPFLGLFSNLTSSPATPATVGVEFDTHWDRDLDPKDINANHVGINLNSIGSVSYTKDMLKGELFGAMSADITYDAGSKIMAVTLRLADGGTHSIQALIDFVAVAAGVPQEVAIGFSAATGVDVFETHLLLSWSFSSTDLVSVSSNMPLWLIISLSVATPLLAATVVAALVWGIMRTQRRAQAGMNIPLRVAKEFSYEELSVSTNNFSDDRKLGAGAFGEVYRGLLRDPGVPGMLPVAVKMLIRHMDPQTRRDYVTEIMTLGQLSHRNLVRLIGWSNGGGRKVKPLLLVYELVTNRSLDEHLHGHDRLLRWPERYNVVRDLGHAIEYLHTGSKEPILHRDIKPANVMLDDEFRAKLGDFGLVRQVHPGEESLGGTAMVGTCDYMDPKCMITFTASTASDMYSFGVLLSSCWQIPAMRYVRLMCEPAKIYATEE